VHIAGGSILSSVWIRRIIILIEKCEEGVDPCPLTCAIFELAFRCWKIKGGMIFLC